VARGGDHGLRGGRPRDGAKHGAFLPRAADTDGPLSVRRAELASGAVRDAGERTTPACGRDRQMRRQPRDPTACARRGLSARAAARASPGNQNRPRSAMRQTFSAFDLGVSGFG
jgi:hypothetical protein